MTENQYEEVIKQTCDVLDSNTDVWVKRYDGFAENIIKNRDIRDQHRRMFQQSGSLYVYSSIGGASDSKKTSTFNLRFAGQSVADVIVNPSDKIPVKLRISEFQDKATEKYFGLKNSRKYSGDWKKATEFRRIFNELPNTKNTGSKFDEHRVENKVLVEFHKRTRKEGKLLCNIQPIILNNSYFQLTTPLAGSKHDPHISSVNGGGIDILARVKHIDNRDRIAVIELKNDNKSSEPQREVMKQALIYATFIAYLLRGKKSDLWWSVFGFKKAPSYAEKNLVIDVVSLMPEKESGKKMEGSLEALTVPTLPNVTLQPYTLYYKQDKDGNPIDFVGTLKDDLMK